MALPTGPIPLVAVDEIIEESWGDSVAQSLNNINQLVTWKSWNPAPGAEFFADNDGLMGTWFQVGAPDPTELVVPDWARQAFVTYTLSGVIYDPPGTSTRTSYLLQAEFGTLQGRKVRFSGQGGWFGMAWTDQFLDIEDVAGDRHIRIKAQRLEGTTGDAGPPMVEASRWKFYDQSDIGVQITYYPPVDFYPAL